MIAVIVIAVIVAVVVIWAIATYNGLVGQRNQVEEAFSTMDVFLQTTAFPAQAATDWTPEEWTTSSFPTVWAVSSEV